MNKKRVSVYQYLLIIKGNTKINEPSLDTWINDLKRHVVVGMFGLLSSATS